MTTPNGGVVGQPQGPPLGKTSCEASSSTSPLRGSGPPAAIAAPHADNYATGRGRAGQPARTEKAGPGAGPRGGVGGVGKDEDRDTGNSAASLLQ